LLIDSMPEEIQILRKVTQDIVRTRVAPMVAEIEESGTFSYELLDVMKSAGWLSVVLPLEDGTEADLRASLVVIEELAKVFPTSATILTPHWFAVKVITRSVREPWVSGFLARLEREELLGALAATEPDAGSDLASVRTAAKRTDRGWTLRGAKRFITNGGHADFYLVLARSDAEGRSAQGLSLFYVESERPGLRFGRVEKKMGLRASETAEVFFDDVEVPFDHLVGSEGSGFHQMMDALVEGRIVIAALAVGIAAGALEHAVSYAKERVQFGRPIAAFQGLQFLIADMAIKTDAARSLTYDAAEAYRFGHADAPRLAAAAKVFASDSAMAVTTDAVQVLGGVGYTRDFPVEMLMRDAKIQQIYEGTNEVQRMVIGRACLGDAARG
jgi:alkylation response protein AidB-like acyl-CoA dehydrogenase